MTAHQKLQLIRHLERALRAYEVESYSLERLHSWEAYRRTAGPIGWVVSDPSNI